MKKFIFLPVLLFALSSCARAGDLTGRAMLDLKTWDLKTKSILTLDNVWEFYWNKLLTPQELNKSKNIDHLLIKPGSWSDIETKAIPVESKGFATYRITLVNVPSVKLALSAYSMQTSYRVFINGQKVIEVGKPGITKEKTTPANRDVEVDLPVTDTIGIVVQVANFHHRKGGFVHPFEIGTKEAITKQHQLFYSLDFIESSALAIIGLFLFALFIFRRKDFSILYFSLFCITLCFRPVISVNYLMSSLFPDMSWYLLVKMEYLSVMFPCLFMLLFMKELFAEQLPKKIMFALKWILILKIVVVIFFPPVIFSWLILPLLFIIPFGVILFSIAIIKAVIAKVEGANYAGAGIVVLLSSLILKVMVYSGILPPVYVLITVMDIGFIFMMSLILGSRFSLQFARVEALQKKTEQQAHEIERKKELVEEKNKEILDSIHYAKRIQDALLPSQKYIERSLKRFSDKK